MLDYLKKHIHIEAKGIGKNFLLAFSILFTCLFCSSSLFSQNNNDYRSRADNNWSTNNTWAWYDLATTTWTNTNNDPGEANSTGLMTIRAGHDIILNLNRPAGANTIGSLDVIGTLTFQNNQSRTLTLLGNVTGTGAISMAAGTGFPVLTLGGNWTKTGIFTSGTGTVVYNGGAAQIVGALNYNNLTFSGAGAKNAAGNIAIANTLNNASTFDMAGSTLTLGTTTTNTGTIRFSGLSNGLAINAGTIEYYGNTQNVASGTYVTINITATGTKTALNNITATTLDNGGAANVAAILDMAGYTLTATTIENTNATIRFSGATNGFAIATGTVDYYGTGQTVTSGTYNNLTLSNSSGTNTANANLTINGTLTTTAGGTLDMGTNTFTTLNAFSNGGIIKTSNTTATPLPSGRTWGGTVEYGVLAGGQTIAAGTYNNLTLDNTTGSNSTGGNIVVSGTFAAAGGGTLNTDDDITLNGTTNCLSAGNINATAGTITYSATATSIVAGTYNNLVIPNNATLCGNITVNGLLTLGTGLNYNGYTISGLPTLTTVTMASDNANTSYAIIGDVVTLTITASENLSSLTGTIDGKVATPAGSGTSWTLAITTNGTFTEGLLAFSISFSDVSGNAGTAVTAVTAGTKVNFDMSPPALSTVTMASDNANTAFAKEGHTVTLTITADEDLSTLSGTIDGKAAIAAGSGTAWTLSRLTDGTETEGLLSFSIGFSDIAGNSGTAVTAVTSGTAVTYDETVPTIGSVHIQSDNATNTLAKVGDVITLTFTGSETLTAKPAVTIATHGIVPASVTNTGGDNWQAVYTMASGDAEVAVPFTIDFTDLASNAGIQVSTVSDASSVTFDETEPTAAITYSPTTGYYKSGASVTITATFSEPVADSPIPQIELSGVEAIALTNMTKSSSTVYTYTYTIPAGDGTQTVALGTATDLAGNAITTIPTSGATFEVDNTNPTAAITYSPITGLYKSGASLTITATFNEPMADSPIPQIALIGVEAIALTNMTKTSATVYTYIYTIPAGNGTQTVEMGTGTDIAGNTVTTVPTSGATFNVDNTPPTVTLLSPLDNAGDVGSNDNLVLTFDENVQAGTADDIVIYNSDNSVFETIPYNDLRIGFAANVVTINPSGTLLGNASYYIQIANTAITDIAGNAYAGINNTTDWNFSLPLPYFRSKAAGPANWNNIATWESSSDNATWADATFTPTDANSTSIVIQAGHTVDVTASVQADDGTVDGTLIVNSGQTLTIANGAPLIDLVVSTTGTINNAGTILATGAISFDGNSNYLHNQNGGTLPTATWANTSTVTNNPNGNATLNGMGQTFGNFIYSPTGAITTNIGQSTAIAGNMTLNGGIFNADGFNINLSGNLTGTGDLTYTSGQLNIAGNYNNTGTFTAGTGTVNYNGSGAQTIGAVNYYNLTISGGDRVNNNVTLATGTVGIANIFDITAFNTTGAGIITTAAGNTVDYNGSVIQSITANTILFPQYNNLTVSLPAAAAVTRAKSLAGNIVVGGNLNVSGNATLRVSFRPATYNLNIIGTTNINNNGDFQDIAIAGTNLFNGLVTINNGGRWLTASNPAFEFRGGLTFDGTTFTCGTGIYSFSTNNQAISGSVALVITNIASTTSGVTLTNNHTVSLTVSTLTGSGNFANGLNSNFYFAGSTIGLTGTADFSSNTNNVYYSRANVQNIFPATYSHLYLTNGNIKTISGNVTVNGNLTIQNNSSLSLGAAGQNFTLVGDLSAAAGAIVMNSANQILNLGGTNNVLNTLTSTAPTATVNYNRAGDQQVISSVNYRNLTFSGSGNKNLQGPITVNTNLTISGGNLATDIYQITGNATGIMSMAAGATLSLGNTGSATSVLFPTNFVTVTLNSASTVIYQTGGNQNVAAFSYGNLTIGGGFVKTILAPSTINGALTLSDGNLALGFNNLTLASGASVAGAFDNTHMIVTDNTGSLIKQGTPADIAITYPLGTSTVYSPVIISGSAGSGSGDFSIRVVEGKHPNAFNGVAKYWPISASGGLIVNSGTLVFHYDDSEISGDENEYSANQYAAGLWQKPVSVVNTAANTVTATLSANINGDWAITEKVTLYSYKSGLWHDANTWTTDPSGNDQIGAQVPGNSDNVVILNGYTVQLGQNVTTADNSIDVNTGGILNLNGYEITQTLKNLDGTGKIQTSRVNLGVGYFPAATSNTFVNAAGGTYEYKCTGDFSLPSQTIYNNIVLNLSTNIDIATQVSNITVNGNLSITKGVYQINDASASSRTLSVTGNIEIAGGSSLTVGSGAALHNIILSGNFINEGTVDITNNADYAANTGGAVNIEFAGTSNASVAINATTSFYGFIVNKGVDQSIVVEVTSFAATSPFDGNFATNVITLNNGTLKLGGNITVSRLKTAVTNYDIGANAGLWVDGATVTLGAAALVVYGNLKIGHGSFNAMGMGQGSIVTRDGGSLYIENGTLTANQIRPSNTAVHTGSFIITGGIINVNGPATVDDYPVFAWPHAASQFQMSGGILNISSPTATGSAINGGILIGVGPENYSITGGTVNVTIPASATNFNINSTVPFWDLNINKAGAGAGTVTLADQTIDYLNTAPPVSTISARSLTVLNNLTINGTNSPTLNADGQNLSVKGNFTINTGATYTPGANTTIFNGTSAQAFDNSGTITTGLNKLKIDKSAGTLTLGGTATTYTVADSLIITQGTIDDGGKTINVAGHIYYGGTHTGSGKIVMNSNALRTIEASPFGTPALGNLEINNTNGTAGFVATQLLSNVTVNSLALTSNHILNADIFGLTVNTNPITGGAFSATRMIRTAGNASDKGLTIAISGTYPINTVIATYPLGTAYGYTPAEVRTNATGNSGALSGTYTIIPVNSMHPSSALILGNYYVIDYYWKSITTITGATNANIDIRFTFFTVPPGEVFGLIPYRPWLISITGANLLVPAVTVSNLSLIPYAATGFITSDYSVGASVGGNSPFNFLVRTLYSRNAATLPRNWSENDSWCTTADGTGPGVAPPTAQDKVFIRDGHTTIVDAATRTCATLTIGTGSIFDLGTTTGHTFDVVSGIGKIRISSAGATARFPTGDFGNFLGTTGGTVEYYTTGAVDFSIPTNQGLGGTPLTNYRYLEVTPATGRYIAMPNTDLEIFNNLTVQGASATGVVRLNTEVSKTLLIDGNLLINSGTLQFRSRNIANTLNGTSQTLNLIGNATVANGALFNMDGTVAIANTMNITGNFTNNGTVDFNNTNTCNLVFNKSTDQSFTGTGSGGTDLSNLTVNMGSSQTPILTLNVNGAFTSPANNWLTLSNGTFRYMNASALNLSTTNTFTIAQTAVLQIENASTTVTLANADADNNDLYLYGKLHIVSGAVNIGNSANNRNNDIEYSESGISELVIDGGSLVVNGQIRRGLLSLGGILKYEQTGGAVTIYGRNATATRAKFEVVNTGSIFTLTGGSLTLVRGGGTTYGDLYLRPASATTSAAGNIFLATATGTGNQTFLVDANVPLSGLTVNGFDATNRATARLNISSLELDGGLSINSFGTFNTNNLNLSLSGNFVNNGIFTCGTTDVTTFNGATQTLLGSNTTFCNLTANASNSVTLLSNITINNGLSILSGTFDDNSNTAIVKGNIDNSGIHQSGSTIAGGLLLQGTTNQSISGNGQFGRIVLDNLTGAKLLNDMSINNRIELTQGILNIRSYKLSLGVNADITATLPGSFSTLRMISTDGIYGNNAGIEKSIATGATNLLFPIGVTGKYTPVRIDVNENLTDGTILVKPVNTYMPSVTDPNNVLQYYWYMESNGLSGFDADVYFTYIANDLKVVAPNTDENYISARFDGNSWSKLDSTYVDEVLNEILYPFYGADNILGEYTAGIDAALPTTLPVYTSTNVDPATAEWDDITNWERTDQPGVVPAGGPRGVNVIIKAGDIIKPPSLGNISSYSTTIDGTLDVTGTYGHNIGNVSGMGTLVVSDKLPSGKYAAFFSCLGGTLECGGNMDYTLSNVPRTIKKLVLSGSGLRIMPAVDYTICESLEINGTTILDNTVNNRTLTLLGSILRAAGASFYSGSGSIIFGGTSLQTIGAASSFVGVNAFNNVTVNNAAGLILSDPVDFNGNLTLTTGVVQTDATNILRMTDPTATVSTGSATAYISGPFVRSLNGSATNAAFPIGKNSRFGGPFYLLNYTTGNWEAEYYDAAFSTTVVNGPTLVQVSENEHWRVKGEAGQSTRVRLRWNSQSDITPVSAGGVANIVVAENNTTPVNWTMQASTANVGGYVVTNSALTLDEHYYTLGSITTVENKAWFANTTSICTGEQLSVDFTGGAPGTYSLDYSIGAVDQTQLTGIAAGAIYTGMPTATAGTYLLTGFDYNNGTVPGVVETTTVTVAASPTTTAAILISGANPVCAGALSPSTSFRVTTTGATARQWQYSTNGGGTWANLSNVAPYTGVLTARMYISSATSAMNGYQYRCVSSNTSCSVTSAPITLGVNDKPVITSNPAATTICSGDNATFTVAATGATSYQWQGATGATGPWSNLTVSALYPAVDAATLDVIGATTTRWYRCLVSNASSCNIYCTSAKLTVTPNPAAPGIISGTATLCQGATGVSYSVPAISGATSYIWSYDGDGENIIGTTNSITINYSSTATSGNLTVQGVNACGNGPVSANYAVTVNTLPGSPGAITGNATVCDATSEAYSIDPIAGAVSYTWLYSEFGATINGTTESITIDYASGVQSGNITVRGVNACGNGPVSANYGITVNTIPEDAGTISGTAAVCQGVNGVAYSIPTIARASSYAWSYDGSGATIIGATDAITINFASNATSGILTVYGTNTCGDGAVSADFVITINPLPDNAGTISGTATINSVQSGVPYSISAITNATSYVWDYTGTNVTINGTTNSVTLDFPANATSGILTVYGTNACGSGVISPDYSITVSLLPDDAGSITGVTPVCQGAQDVPYSVGAILRATTYTWSYTGLGVTFSDNSNSITIDFANNATSGILRVRGTNINGNGVVSPDFNITVNPLPVSGPMYRQPNQ